MKKIFIIILNFNGKEDIIECLNSLKEEKAKIVVVDNGSTDNSLQLVNRIFPKIKVIKNKKNLGFAAGNNIGIRYALRQGAEAIMLLNQDTIAQQNFLEPLVKWMNFNKNVGVLGSVIKHDEFGEVQYDLGGKINWWLGKATHINKDKIDIDEPIERDYVSGCCMLVKKEVFEKIGLLDEKFFLYFEDDDFCTRAIKQGFSVWVVPKSQIYHKLSTSTGFFSKKMIYYCTRNALFFSKKHLSPIKWPLVLGWILLTSLYFTTRKRKAGIAAFMGVKDFLLGRMGKGRDI